MNKEEMIKEFQCPGCAFGPGPEDCPKFALRDMDLGGFRCEGHAPGTMTLGDQFMHPQNGNGLRILLGLPQPFGTMTRDAEKSHTLVLIDNEGGKRWLGDGTRDSQNIPVWKRKHEGCTLVRIARPATCRYTTLVIDGDVDVPAPAIEVGDEDGIL